MSSDVTDRDTGLSTTAPPGTPGNDLRGRTEAVAIDPKELRKRNFLIEFYRSALGKKYAMAISGLIMMGYVVAHMLGNLKLYAGAESLDGYAEFLRDILYPILPHGVFLWLVRPILLAALVIHLHAAWVLTRLNRKARPKAYQSKRHYIAVDFAGRTMRWTGIIVLLFIVFHLADLTFGWANPDFVSGDVYNNTVASFQRWPVALIYIVANLALGFHLYHGAWSMFQSLGINKPRFNLWRRWFAVAFAVVVVVGNVSFPLAVMTGVIA
jgi:succinate dehydrogenase / fumarate reductase cytochrome b subunit